MATIVPAILEQTAEAVAQKLLLAKEFAPEVQVDIVDGSFASPATWPYQEGLMTHATMFGPLPHAEILSIELDLMVDDPERALTTWMNLGARRALFHIESTLHLKDILQTLSTQYGYSPGFMSDSLSVGIAINVDTRLELLEPYVDLVDYVQFMGIKRIGVQGQLFAPEVLHTIQLFREKHPHMQIQVDGGVTFDVATKLLPLGVSRLAVGSAIWDTEHPARSYQQFVSLGEHYGIYE